MSHHDPKNPRVVLEEDHRHIHQLLGRLIACVRADDRESAIASWARAEKALQAHFEVEEAWVFPALSKGNAGGIEALLVEHAELRRQLDAIGLMLELHTVRAETVEAFCVSLHAHARGEESLVYADAERGLPPGVARSIVDRPVRATATSASPPRASASRPPS